MRIKFLELNTVIFEKFKNLEKYKKNQLYSIIPPYEFIKNIFKILINKDIDKDKNIYFEFSKNDMIKKDIKKKINEIIPELRKYYLKCKQHKYLENLNEKKIITILRQLIKPYDYNIKTKEQYDNGKKFLLYVLYKINCDDTIKKIDSVINFD
jgi:hypothetical protein